MNSATDKSIGSFQQFLSLKASWILCILAVFLLVFRLGSYYLLDAEAEFLSYLTENLGLSLFGLNEFSARTASSLSAALVLVLIAWQHKPLAAGILLSSLGFFISGHLALVDMPLNLCVSAAILFFYRSCLGPNYKNYFYLSSIFSGFATGLHGVSAGLLILSIILSFLVLQNNLWNFLQEYRKELSISAIILLPFLYLSKAVPESFIVEIHSLPNLLLVLIGFLPWLIFLPRILWDIIRPMLAAKSLFIPNPLLLLSCVWASLVFILSLNDSAYIVNIYSPMSIILASWFFHEAPKLSLYAIGISAVLLLGFQTLIVEPYINQQQSNLVLFARNVPEYAELVAVEAIPPSLKFYAKQIKNIKILKANDFQSYIQKQAPIYFIAKNQSLSETEIEDFCEVFQIDSHFIYGKNLV